MNIIPGKLKENPKFTLFTVIFAVIIIAAITTYSIVMVVTNRNSGSGQGRGEASEQGLIEYTGDDDYIDDGDRNVDEDTDSRAVDAYEEKISKFLEDYPIVDILPLQSEDPYYYIDCVVDEKQEGVFEFKLEVSYINSAGRTAAESRLAERDIKSLMDKPYTIVYRLKRN